MIRAMQYIGFPKANNPNTALVHVGVLRMVKPYPALLPLVLRIVFAWVSMPVFAVKLNSQISRRHERINGEFPANRVLLDVLDTDTVKDSEARLFQFVGADFLLSNIHAQEHCGAFRVFVSALNGTIGNVVCLGAGRRPAKRLTAYLAGVFCLVAPLPFVSVLNTAEVMRCNLKALFGGVKRFAAQLAGDFLTRLSLRAFRTAIATKRTILLVWAQSAGNSFTATLACNGTNSVFVHAHIITLLSRYA